jgi:Ras-related protein Rab-5C
MFDVSRKPTFDALDMWIRELSKHGGENLPVYVVGNKTDVGLKRKVTKDEGEKWVKFRKFEGYFETSAKEQTGYLQLFAAIADKCS